MCKAMNRSLVGVLLGIKGTLAKGREPTVVCDVAKARLWGARTLARSHTLTPPPPHTRTHSAFKGECVVCDVPMAATDLTGARRVLIVPGFGLAVAKGQHSVASLISLLRANGKEVEVAIHPVAGRSA